MSSFSRTMQFYLAAFITYAIVTSTASISQEAKTKISTQSNLTQQIIQNFIDRPEPEKSSCKVSTNVSKEFLDKTVKVLSSTPSPSASNCTYDLEGNPTSCNEVLKSMQCSIRQLVGGFLDAVDNAEFLKWWDSWYGVTGEYETALRDMLKSVPRDQPERQPLYHVYIEVESIHVELDKTKTMIKAKS